MDYMENLAFLQNEKKKIYTKSQDSNRLTINAQTNKKKSEK